MRDKIGVIQNKSSLLSLIGYIGQLGDDHYQLLMSHVDYQFDKMEQPITMFENDRMILIEGYKSEDGIRYYIRFIKGESDAWKLEIGERANNEDQKTVRAMVYYMADENLRRDTVEQTTFKDGSSNSQTTFFILEGNNFELADHFRLARMR